MYMGLFSKHKEEKNSVAPPPAAPPVPNFGNGINSAPMPPQPQAPKYESAGNIVPPPLPGGSLEDIKSIVSESSQKKSEEIKENESTNSGSEMNSTSTDDFDDSLFDFSDLNIPEPNSETNPEKNANYHSIDNIPKNDYSIGKVDLDERDVSAKRLENQDFIKNKSYNSVPPGNENFFVTTSQFKALLEIVESVKMKVKEANEKHLRLLDIKSEEDIEYENLRRDFQYIEDKLYEADSILFEK